MARINIDLSARLHLAQRVENKQDTTKMSVLAKMHLMRAPASPDQAKRDFVQLNQNPSISSVQRDYLKIRSITKMVVQMTKNMEGVDRNEVAQVVMGLRSQYKKPADYLKALRKHLPSSFDKALELLESSDEIDSIYRSTDKI